MALERPRTLFVVMMDIDRAHEAEFNGWYDQEHIPERRACPGFLSATRYRGLDEAPGDRKLAEEVAPRYLAVYEVESPDVLQSEAYRKLVANPTPWTQEMRTHYSVRVRHTYVERSPGP